MFEESKDHVIAVERLPVSKGKNLIVGIFSYNANEPKVGFYREIEGQRKRAGRLTQGEASWVADVIPELLAKIEG